MLGIISTDRPHLSWVVPLVRNGQEQTACHIAVAPHQRPSPPRERDDLGLGAVGTHRQRAAYSPADWEAEWSGGMTFPQF
jgi:hypothetical protein